MPTYVMQTRGGTEGAETGKYRQYEPGDQIEAPEGEFDHLSDGAYETRPASYETRPATPSDEQPERRYEVKGAYKDFYVGDDLVAENVRCTKDEAKAWVEGDIDINELQSE